MTTFKQLLNSECSFEHSTIPKHPQISVGYSRFYFANIGWSDLQIDDDDFLFLSNQELREMITKASKGNRLLLCAQFRNRKMIAINEVKNQFQWI